LYYSLQNTEPNLDRTEIDSLEIIPLGTTYTGLPSPEMTGVKKIGLGEHYRRREEPGRERSKTRSVRWLSTS
jgi:hypothetical protein